MVAREKGKQSESALVAFTTLVPAALGVAVCALVSGAAFEVVCAAVCVALATVGMAGSVFHLAKPLRAPFSLRHLASSWLSREIAVVSVFWALAVAWLAACAAGAGVAGGSGAWAGLGAEVAGVAALLAGCAPVLCALACVVGFALMFVIARAYRVSPFPAWDGPEGAVELLGGAAGSGGACFAATLAAASLAGTGGSLLRASVAACAFLLMDSVLVRAALRSRERRLREEAALGSGGAGGLRSPASSGRASDLRASRGAGEAAAPRGLGDSADSLRVGRCADSRGGRAALTLGAMAARRGAYRRVWAALWACLALGALAVVLALLAAPPVAVAVLWVVVAVASLAAHAALRNLFYETPVQACHIPPLLK